MSTMANTKSRRPRRRFTDEFKQQAVRLVVDEGKSVGGVARALDLVPSALGQWVNQAHADRSKGQSDDRGTAEDADGVFSPFSPR